MHYPDAASYRRRLEADSVLPKGFETARTSLNFLPAEKPDAGPQTMNLSLIRLTEATEAFAGIFTKNAFPGWPVIMGRRLLKEDRVRGVLINNRVANVRASGGLKTAGELAAALGAVTGDKEPYFFLSTGVIGWSLPQSAMHSALPPLVRNLSENSLLPVAEAMMTTDPWPKLRSASCGRGRLVGAAKGAGMVEPDMATMLALFLTDISLPRRAARDLLPEVMEETFNRISVDGEMSTNDAVLLLASNTKPYPGDAAFRETLRSVAGLLAEDVVRNGEGTTHVFRIKVSGVGDSADACFLARSVARAPLTKTAIRGNDPNVGRILQAVGAACARRGLTMDPERVTLSLGEDVLYADGRFRMNGNAEARLTAYLKTCELPVPAPSWPHHEKRVEIIVDFGNGNAEASVTASDLSEDYVRINADYRS